MERGMSDFYFKAEVVRADSCGTGIKCGRWNPTTEQVKVLTELFRSGLRTPSTDQIQKISNQLSFYGKIESKNVFYWFQNHKARERQKRRKVSIDENDPLACHEDKISKRFLEINHEVPDQRDIETLQLFPINSFNEMEHEKQLRSDFLQANEYYLMERVGSDYPPLDLRLNFM